MDSGTIFAGRFAVEAMAGKGAMGAVFRARDLYADGKVVALKVLHDLIPQRVRRFEREIQVLATLPHPNIVGYVAHGALGHQPWLAMEWIDGMTLGERLARRPLSTAESIAMGIGICDALMFAHGRGVVHRDLKPGNIFLERGETTRIVVLDFGLAHIDEGTKLTKTGTFLGSPGYLAPEQARGEAIDHRADLFSLGCLLYRCLTEVNAFPGRQVAERILKALHEQPTAPRSLRPHLPPDLDDLVMQLLAKHPLRRPGHAAEVRQRLAQIATENSIEIATLDRHPPEGATLPMPPSAAVEPLAFAVISPDPSERPLAVDVPSPAATRLEPPQGLTGTLPLDAHLKATLPMAPPEVEQFRAMRQTLPISSTEAAKRSVPTMPFTRRLDDFGKVHNLPDGSLLVWVKPDAKLEPVVERVLGCIRALRSQGRDVAVLQCDADKRPDPGLFGRGLDMASGPARLDEATAEALRAQGQIGHDEQGPFLIEADHAV